MTNVNASRLELLRCDSLCSDIRPQGFGDQHAAVGLLIVLDDGDPGASDGQAAAVEGVNKLGFIFSLGAPGDYATDYQFYRFAKVPKKELAALVVSYHGKLYCHEIEKISQL